MSTLTTGKVAAPKKNSAAILANRLVLGFSRHWLLVITILLEPISKLRIYANK